MVKEKKINMLYISFLIFYGKRDVHISVVLPYFELGLTVPMKMYKYFNNYIKYMKYC